MTSLGANVGFVDELFARFKNDPASVSEAWREFFADYEPPPGRPVVELGPQGSAVAPEVDLHEPEVVAAKAADVATVDPTLVPLTGSLGRIATNMEASLGVPTATSARTIPVKLVEENRRLLNQHLATVSGIKVSFTHMVAWALVRVLERRPVMNAEYVSVGGKPHLRQRKSIHLGLAVDVERKGERTLLVPNIKDAAALSFPDFVARHDALVTAARHGKLTLEDLTGTTVSITNPGMLGTAMSVPRLMPTQAAIFGIGRIDYPAEYAGMNPRMISELGLSKVMTVTSTYDHRVIQGAESGAFLADLERLLLGEDDFYRRIFRELAVPHEPLAWTPDAAPGWSAAGRGDSDVIEKQASVLQLIRAFRVRGHLLADLNPLEYKLTPQPELELSTYGLSVWDLDRRFVAGGLAGNTEKRSLRDILDTLRETYCRHVGVEYMHIPETEVREWLQEQTERTRLSAPLAAAERQRILSKLNAAEAFERFLHNTYVGQKRFSLEGVEALIPLLDGILTEARAVGVLEAILGMSHRGRLNVLANVVGKSVGNIFREFEGEMDPALSHGSGDVKYHLGAHGTHTTPSDERLSVMLASNPSHLEAVDPVVLGMARARQDQSGDRERQRVLSILIHGDAAFSGQGVVTETLNLSMLQGYRVGGTIHIVVNNQIGFTTRPEHLRSSIYATDVAKAVRAPIFHVNADHPDAVLRVGKLALAFRRAFKRDVVIDLIGYRRWGHNEGDDPSYTDPRRVAQIKNHRSVRKLYTEELLRKGELQPEAAEAALTEFNQVLAHAHEEVTRAQKAADAGRAIAPTLPMEGADAAPEPRTAVAEDTLVGLLTALEAVPDDFHVHPKLLPQLTRRKERFVAGSADWAVGESLAFATLVKDGLRVRLSGEDSGRGTFSHRHAVLYDFDTGSPHIPLAHLHGPGSFQVYDSQLSEFGVLGFEYGYSVNAPNSLVLWEAQFGDFANGAQVIIDQFIASAQEKWALASGLTLLLPHGYEGQGPEHSSARIERYLQLAARDNLRIANPSTPAQFFHLLRRQGLVPARRPLIVFTPKSLLRHPQVTSTPAEFAEGRFAEVMEDPTVSASARRVVLCTGKVYYDLLAGRLSHKAQDVALLRLEQLYPWPHERLSGLLHKYAGTATIVWAQEEPENMGAWQFVAKRLLRALAPGQSLSYVGRTENASPATGSHHRHTDEQDALVAAALR